MGTTGRHRSHDAQRQQLRTVPTRCLARRPTTAPRSSHAMDGLQDEAATNWLAGLQTAAVEVLMANDDANLSSALASLSSAAEYVPSRPVSPERLLSWNADEPAAWLARMDTGHNLSDELGMLTGQLSSMTQNRTPAQTSQILAVSVRFKASSAPSWDCSQLISERPFFRACRATTPTTRGCRTVRSWSRWWCPAVPRLRLRHPRGCSGGLDGMGGGHGLRGHRPQRQRRARSRSLNSKNNSATIGKEIGMLTSAAMLLLGIILWFNFRSVRRPPTCSSSP